MKIDKKVLRYTYNTECSMCWRYTDRIIFVPYYEFVGGGRDMLNIPDTIDFKEIRSFCQECTSIIEECSYHKVSKIASIT